MSILKGIIVAIASFFLIALLVVGCIVHMAVPNAIHDLSDKRTGKVSDAKLTPWSVDHFTEPINDVKGTLISRKSEDVYTPWLGGEKQGDLVFRCIKGKIVDAYIDIGDPASVEYGTNNHTVRYRLDGSKAVTEHWSPSKDGEALFIPSPRSFANKLIHAKKFLFDFDPFNTPSTADLHFDIDGLQAALSSQPDCVK